MGTLVTETPAASSDVALRHFEGMLAFETDCWDVHESLKSPKLDFILVDVREPARSQNGHVQGAINIPHGQMTASRMVGFPKDKLFVVYCAGPHCNGANKAALRASENDAGENCRDRGIYKQGIRKLDRPIRRGPPVLAVLGTKNQHARDAHCA